jgi:hypothetical protein
VKPLVNQSKNALAIMMNIAFEARAGINISIANVAFLPNWCSVQGLALRPSLKKVYTL